MKLENQVCSLELARRLKELGVKEGSYFYWNKAFAGTRGQRWEVGTHIPTTESLKSGDAFHAYSVAELLEKFPMHHNYGAPHVGKANDGDEYIASYVHWYNLWHNKKEFEAHQVPTFLDRNPANAPAKMLVYLLENSLITV